MRKYNRGEIKKLEWLDNLAFKKIDEITPLLHHLKISKNSPQKLSIENNDSKELENDQMYLILELPISDFPLVYNEKVKP